jgi:malonate transporter and related proteins
VQVHTQGLVLGIHSVPMNQPIVDALIPVVLLIAIGVIAGKAKWISAGGIKELSNLVFMVVAPALLFRTMALVHPENVDWRSMATYFSGMWLLFGVVLAWVGFTRRGAVLALAATFSNTVMIGIALVGIAYGAAGLAVLLPIVSLHALVMLTVATLVLEFALLREQAGASGISGHIQRPPVWRTVWLAGRNAVVHPVPLPIIAGLLFAQTGWSIPAVVDKPLQLLGQSFSPLALILVGITLTHGAVGVHVRAALWLTAAKNLLLPALVCAIGWLLGLHGLPLAVVVVTASLPIGANVFLFSQRYGVAQELVTASVAASTILALPSVALVMWLVQFA